MQLQRQRLAASRFRFAVTYSHAAMQLLPAPLLTFELLKNDGVAADACHVWSANNADRTGQQRELLGGASKGDREAGRLSAG